MYKLIEYSYNYSKTSGSLWQYCKEIPGVVDDGDIVSFDDTNETNSFKFHLKITDQTGNCGKIDNVEIMIPLKYVSTFWRTLKIPLINFEAKPF